MIKAQYRMIHVHTAVSLQVTVQDKKENFSFLYTCTNSRHKTKIHHSIMHANISSHLHHEFDAKLAQKAR